MATGVHRLPFWTAQVYCMCARDIPIELVKSTDKAEPQCPFHPNHKNSAAALQSPELVPIRVPA